MVTSSSSSTTSLKFTVLYSPTLSSSTFPLLPFRSGLVKIPSPHFPPRKKETENPDREVKWPNKIKQSKTCQGQDRPRGASQPNKLSRYSLNLLHWFADRGSLAPSKKRSIPDTTFCQRCAFWNTLLNIYDWARDYNHNSINLFHHLYITGLSVWLCRHIIFTDRLLLRPLKKTPIHKISGITWCIFKEEQRDVWWQIIQQTVEVPREALRN